jgi:hypothetical protein
LGHATFRPQGSLEAVHQQASDFIDKVTLQYSAEQVQSAIERGKLAVDELRSARQRREHFHGKRAVDEFYARYLHVTGMKKEIFKFLAAKKARDRKAVTAFFDAFFDGLSQDGRSPDKPEG